MTKKQTAALQRIIDREASQIEWKKQNRKETDPVPVVERAAGIHSSYDRHFVTDGYVAVIFPEKPDGLPEAEEMDGLYDTLRKELNSNNHVLALTVTAAHIREWKKLSKDWKAGKTLSTGAVAVEITAKREDGREVSGFYDPAIWWMSRRLSAPEQCCTSVTTVCTAPSAPCWYTLRTGWRNVTILLATFFLSAKSDGGAIMTRRQIYFFNPDNNTYYLSEELNGDKEEFEGFGSSDSCDKTWAEIAAELSCIQTLPEFMAAVARVMRYYHSCIASEIPGTRLIVKHSRDELEVKDETWGIVAGCPRIFKDNLFSVYGGEQMFYNGRPLYGQADFSYSSVKPGDYVTQDVVDDAMDCLPPACMRSDCSQMGEPYSSKYDERNGKWRNTYATFSQIPSQRHDYTPRENRVWKYCGHCFCGETEERGMDMPIVAASGGGNVNG